MTLCEEVIALERPLLIALDVDGTIAPIVADPDQATVPQPVLDALASLTGANGVRVALITGRDLDSLVRLVPIAGTWRAAEHGGIVLAPLEEPQPKPVDEALRAALTEFQRWTDAHASEALVEVKPRAIAVHVRALAEVRPEAAEALLGRAETKARELGLHVRAGRQVREAEAEPHDKGRALEEIFERAGAAAAFFAGDDLTDLPAIEFATRVGIGAFVLSNERPTPPRVGIPTLAGDAEVASLLEDLARHLA